MIQKVKNKLKDQRGLTLIELLAVIVILAIISAIAIPSILGLIDNSRRDAHVANAQQMINAAKIAYAGDRDIQDDVTGGITSGTDAAGATISLADLVGDGYLETMEDPDGGAYTDGGVVINNTGGTITYEVFLVGSEKQIGDATTPTTVAEDDLRRNSVIDIP